MDKNREAGSMSLLKIGFRTVLRNKLAVFGFAVIVLLILASALAPLLTPHDRDAVDLTAVYQKPSRLHLLGTDEVGRDVLTRLLYSGRVSLSVGLVSTSIAAVIGVLLGAIAGYYGGTVDFVISRMIDIVMCFPFFVIAIALAAIMGPGIWNIMIISGVLSWTSVARMVRAQTLSLREREFIEAARALGLNSLEIILKHIIPNVSAIIIVYTTLGIAGGILSEAGLSFMGIGIKLPTPSWGNMLSAAQNLKSLQHYWWLWVPPGLLIFLTVLSINFLGDGLRDALDPKSIKR